MPANDSWARARDELIRLLVRKGYPAEFGELVAKNLGSEKLMRRMSRYLELAKPRSAEEIVDEMLAIMEDRSRWIKKKEAEQANQAYTDWVNGTWREEDDI